MKKSVAASEKPVKAKEFDKELFKRSVEYNVRTLYRKNLEEADAQQIFQAVSYAIKDRIVENWMETQKAYEKEDPKMVYYMSMEFLMGRALGNNLINLKAYKPVAEALEELGLDLNLIEDQEPDAALGNGGLGRLAACFLDSLATLGYPAYGCGIRYRYGMFKQEIRDGYQVEVPDNWLMNGNPFELRRPEYAKIVKFGGYVSVHTDENGRNVFTQEGYQSVKAIPFDFPIVGYGNGIVNTLRIWDAEPVECFQLDSFDKGDYQKAVEQENLARNIVEVLYPNDNHYAGKELRLKQQYFFVSATIQSITRKLIQQYGTLKNFHEKNVIQINDTHPTLVIPELMRILIDDAGLSWDEAWDITRHSVAYTNHTVLAEALESWPQRLFETLLPRIWQIMQEIARRWQQKVDDFYHDPRKTEKMAVIWDGVVHMANLCIAGGMAVNGVSALHSDILRRDVFRDACGMEPDKFRNVTNGVDHRRWISQINPGLDGLIRDCIGDGYLTHAGHLSDLDRFADDAAVLSRLEQIKGDNKQAFARWAKRQQEVTLNTDAIFNVQVKRLHEYKRQLLNVLHIISLYQQLQDDPNMDFRPQTFLFGAKAAPGYAVAKRIIRLINSLADQINSDPICRDKLQVVFLENYRVSMAEMLMPASEVSQQISTAGKEASGTGNMKFMMNGALTLGTLDGANVEMHQVLGDENMFLFGLTADEAARLRQSYDPYLLYTRDPVLHRVLDQLKTGFRDGVSYEDLYQRLLYGADCPADQYLLLADFASYCAASHRVVDTYADREKWNRMSLHNIARSGIFSADRSIADYADTIWHVPYKK